MRELPIIFSGPMVRALLAGTKTQTRRIIKGVPDDCTIITCSTLPEDDEGYLWCHFGDGECDGAGVYESTYEARCPYKPGDRLYVKETHWVGNDKLGYGNHCIVYDADKKQYWHPGSGFDVGPDNWESVKRAFRKCPSIHLPKSNARIWLTVTDVRVQRVQDISEEDAEAEGWPGKSEGTTVTDFGGAACWFRSLWNLIHGDGAWNLNHWVWCYTFSVDERA